MDTPNTPIVLPAQPTSFIGRETEIAEISTLLADPACRLLTLTGLGGMGKTRLAIAVARRMQPAFPDGIYFVPLQPLQSADQIITTLVNVVNLNAAGNPRADLLSYFRHKQLLLVLDNFEHLLAGVDLISDILNRAIQVKILATSREALKIQEEWVRHITGLDYPRSEPSLAAAYSALDLFEERARHLRGDLDFTTQHSHIVHICQLVEGMPLALELAAGWVQTLSCQEIANELQHNLDLLASRIHNIPTRHRSMQAVFDYSWQLLTDHEQVVLRRMSVFQGGCTREAAEHVTGATIDTLATLVEKSLLQRDPDTERFSLQELLRQFAAEELEAAHEYAQINDVHLEHYSALLREADSCSGNPHYVDCLDMIEADFENVRMAWAWALKQGNYIKLSYMVNPIWSVGVDREHYYEARALFVAATRKLAKSKTDDEHALLGRILARQAKCEQVLMNYAQSEKAFRQSIAIARQYNDLAEIAYSLRWLAMIIVDQGDLVTAQEMLEECLQIYQQLEDQGDLSFTYLFLALLAGATGKTGECRSLFLQSLQIRRQLGMHLQAGHSLKDLGIWEIRWGQWDEAHEHIEESESLFAGCRYPSGMAQVMARHSQLALVRGQLVEAQQIADNAFSYSQHVSDSRCGAIVTATSLFTLSYIMDARGEHAEANRLAQQAMTFARQEADDILIMEIRSVLGWSFCGLAKFEQAIVVICEMLEKALVSHSVAYTCFGLAAFTRILAHQGESSLVVELLGLSLNHSNSPRGYFGQHQGLRQLRADLEEQLGSAAYNAAWKRGTQLNPETVARELLHEFGIQSDFADTDGNSRLPAPLTPRELEVLNLIAEGLTNPRIAERLFIETGTVKGYTSQIYSKLGVENRVQAAARAQELHLL